LPVCPAPAVDDASPVPGVLPVPAGGLAPLAPPVLGLLDAVLPLLLELLLSCC